MRHAVLLCVVVTACGGDDEPSGLLVSREPHPGIEAAVTGARLEGESLVATFRYAGCDAPHSWAWWGGFVNASAPPQVVVTIYHSPEEDCGRGLRTAETTIDIAKVLEVGRTFVPVGMTLRILVNLREIVWTRTAQASDR